MTEEEIIIIKEFIKYKELYYQKFLRYSEYAVDPQMKQYFEKLAITFLKDKENIINYL